MLLRRLGTVCIRQSSRHCGIPFSPSPRLLWRLVLLSHLSALASTRDSLNNVLSTPQRAATLQTSERNEHCSEQNEHISEQTEYPSEQVERQNEQAILTSDRGEGYQVTDGLLGDFDHPPESHLSANISDRGQSPRPEP